MFRIFDWNIYDWNIKNLSYDPKRVDLVNWIGACWMIE